MKIESPNESPNGIIEVFKQHKIYELFIKYCQKKGDVKCELVINEKIILNYFYYKLFIG